MKPLSDTLQATLEKLRCTEILTPLLRFELDPSPRAVRGGWQVGRLRDGTPLVVMPRRRALLRQGAERVALYDWLRAEVQWVAERVEQLSDDRIEELIEAKWGSVAEALSQLGQGTEISEEDALYFLTGGAETDDDAQLVHWLPDGVSADDVQRWHLLVAEERWALVRDGATYLRLEAGGLERMTPRETAVRLHRQALAATTRALASDLPEPWSEWGTIGYVVLAAPLIGLFSLVVGLAIAALIAVLGLFLTELGVGLPEAPPIGWLVGVPIAITFLVVSLAIARHGGD